MNEKQTTKMFWLIIWFILGVIVLAVGPTRITYACIWVLYLFELLFNVIDDGNPPAFP